MKKILLFLLIVVSLTLVGCTNEYKIEFYIDNDIKTHYFKNEIVITDEVINEVIQEEINGLYYDEKYIFPYNNEVLKQSTNIYVLKNGKRNVTIRYKSEEEIIQIDNGSSILLSDITLLKTDYIQGLYYDEQFTKPYNDELIEKNLTLYVKAKPVTITLNYEQHQEKITVDNGYILSPKDLSYEKEEYLENIYTSRHYYTKYDNEPIYEDATFFVKTKTITVKIICDSTVHEIDLFIGSKVDDMVLARLEISYIKNLYLDKDCTKLYDGSILEKDTILYASLDNLHNAISKMKVQVAGKYNASTTSKKITAESVEVKEYIYYDEETTVVKMTYDAYPKSRQNSVMKLAGYMFFQEGCMIRVFKNDTMYELKEAYDKGIIDDEFIKKIYFANDGYGIDQTTITDGPFTSSLLIILNKKGTFSFKEYTVEDFKEYGVVSLEEITKETIEIVKDKYLYNIDREGHAVRISDDFRRMFKIELATTDSYEILDIVRKLYLRDDIMLVSVSRKQ